MHYTSAAVFEELVALGTPVLAQFSAPWCAPCRAIVPVVTEIAKAYAEKLSVVILNVEEAPEIVSRLGIRGIPHIQLFHDGVAVDAFSDVATFSSLSHYLDANLGAQIGSRA